MHDLQFDLHQMSCAYRPGHPVLEIEHLSVQRGHLVFVLGISGIGKSTFIESLGLMNDLITANDTTRIRFFSTDGKEHELKNLWRESNEAISGFRDRYFSFIFQNTNLMPHFSAGENMCISQLIGGKDMASAKQEVLRYMDALGLPESVFDQKVTNLSGGQRQRLAFVRAVTAPFEVLFGDEPTGNLDRFTGTRLMSILQKHLRTFRRTGIIVSHDTALALQFADQIVLLTPHPDMTFGRVKGYIDSEHCISRKGADWYDMNDRRIAEPESFIQQSLSTSIIAKNLTL